MTRIRMLSLAAAVWAVLFAASVGKAEKLKGTFTLPYEVEWHQATLPAGEYSFRIDTEKSPQVLTLRGPQGAVMVVESGTESIQWEMSALIVERIGGRNIVTQLRLLEAGRAFNYPPRKPEGTYVVQIPEYIQYVRVEVARVI